MKNNFVAHISKNHREQSLLDHLKETAEIARSFAHGIDGFKMERTCYLAGFLHDSGKLSNAFQTYLRDATAGKNVARGSIDHSYAGGLLLWRKYHAQPRLRLATELISNAIISHHAPTPTDFVDPIHGNSPYLERMDMEINNHQSRYREFETVKERFFDQYISEQELDQMMDESAQEVKAVLEQNQPRTDKSLEQLLGFLTKMIYSIVVDADRIGTANFERNLPLTLTPHNAVFLQMQQNYREYRSRFQNNSSIDQIRDEISNSLAKKSLNMPPGIYRITLPTGSGKTLASLGFALESVIHNQQRQIIYSAPYLSIIEQTANTYRNALGLPDEILEFHSNVTNERKKDSEDSQEQKSVLRYVSDSWDAPVICTTVVAFLNNIYAGGSTSGRRFHRYMNSLLIFDEIQNLPIKLMGMFNSVIRFLSEHCHTTVILMSATQPALETLDPTIALPQATELIDDYTKYEDNLVRVQITDESLKEGYNLEKVVATIEEQLSSCKSLLTILNTKSSVRQVYELLCQRNPSVNFFQLTTNMCPEHRIETLSEVEGQLKELKLNKLNAKVCLIATPLIEAGVDISFERVIRSITGLDSIAQAAGRCNRNNEDARGGKVLLINPNDKLENLMRLPDIKIRGNLAKQFLARMNNATDLLHSDVQFQFFSTYYENQDQLAKYPIPHSERTLFGLIGFEYQAIAKEMYQQTGEPLPLNSINSWRTISRYFQVIDSNTKSVIVPYNDEANEIIEQLSLIDGYQSFRGSDANLLMQAKSAMKKAQRYVIQLYSNTFDKLVEEHLITSLVSDELYKLSPATYSKTVGVTENPSDPLPTELSF